MKFKIHFDILIYDMSIIRERILKLAYNIKRAQDYYKMRANRISVPVDQINIVDEISDEMTLYEMKDELTPGFYAVGDSVYKVDNGNIAIVQNVTAVFDYDTSQFKIVDNPVNIPEVPKVESTPKKDIPSAKKEIVDKAIEATDSLSYDVKYVIDTYQHGVMVGIEGPIDKLYKKNYDLREHFNEVRDLIRKVYGDYVILYRAEDIDESRHIQDKPVLAFTLNKRIAMSFMDKGRVLRKVKAPIDAIWAVIRTSDRPMEFLMETNKVNDLERIPYHKTVGQS